MIRAPEQGFSLIEALVALLILAITTVSLIRASETHVDSIRGLELRAAALWVAENRLAELNLPGAPTPSAKVEMLGSTFDVTVAEQPTDDAALRAVQITVAAANRGPSVTVNGFRDAEALLR